MHPDVVILTFEMPGTYTNEKHLCRINRSRWGDYPADTWKVKALHQLAGKRGDGLVYSQFVLTAVPS